MYQNIPTYRKTTICDIVLGTAGLGGIWGTVDIQESISVIEEAVRRGIQRLDTAPAYGDAEYAIGKACANNPKKRPFISTKVGKLAAKKPDGDTNDYSVATMKESISKSMELLKCNQLDLLFLHEPEKVPVAQITEVIAFLKQLKTDGKAKTLGLGGIIPQIYHQYLSQSIFSVSMGFNRLDLTNLDAMQDDIPLFKQYSMTIYQGSPLHMGLLGSRFAQYSKTKPDWISNQEIVNARNAEFLAKKHHMALSTMAHRFLFSISEIDFVVLGPKNMTQLEKSLSDYESGPLEVSIFNKIITSFHGLN